MRQCVINKDLVLSEQRTQHIVYFYLLLHKKKDSAVLKICNMPMLDVRRVMVIRTKHYTIYTESTNHNPQC